MKLKSAIKYRYSKIFKIVAVFYILMLELVIGSFIITKINNHTYAFTELFAIIMWGFTFVLGIISYSGELNMFMQNGISRQTTHKSFIALLPINFVLSFVSVIYDYFSFLVDKKINPHVEFYCNHMFPGVGFTLPDSAFAKIVIYGILVGFTYTLIMTFGYMLGAISRSMRLFYKVLFGSVIIAVVVFGFVLVNSYSFEWVENLVMLIRLFFLGVYYAPHGRIGNFIVALLVFSVINLSVAHLLINRATVKKGADKK